MNPVTEFEPVFVDEIPRELEQGKLYISVEYTTVIHLCACGCASEVVTPLHPARWALTYDGERVSLWPSVGSWNLPCRSHYVIKHSQVRWARGWTEERITAGRLRDRAALERYFEPDEPPQVEMPSSNGSAHTGWRHRVNRWLRR